MRLIVEKKYIVVPVNTNATTKKLCFFERSGEERTLVMDLDCKIDLLAPNFTAYVDVSRYIGREFEYESVPQMSFTLTQSDERDLQGLFHEPYRPFVHYTPKNGWLNDPNGMIKYHGVYHMFYQYNPCGIEWGHMHWGHATSTDLFHWEEQDIALFPDSMGTMYSGSAIEDTHNVTGLQEGELPPMLLFYTAAGDRTWLSKGKYRTQCLAYSTDGGRTFQKYEKNPIIASLEIYNRDPKCVWVEELGKYLIVLYLANDRYGLFVSDDMLNWTLLQEMVITNERECPDIQAYWIDKKKYWVIMGASDIYVVGTFEGGKFVEKTQAKQLCYSKCTYAGQSISGMDDGRVVRITWQKLKMPCPKVSNQMSIPQEMKLTMTDKGFFLTVNPVEELSALHRDTEVATDMTLTDEYEHTLATAAYDIHLVSEFKGIQQLSIFGHTLVLNSEENCVSYGKIKIPLSCDLSLIDMRIIVDRCNIEIYTDGGKFYGNLYTICDYNLPYLQLSTSEAIQVDKLSISRLEGVHD